MTLLHVGVSETLEVDNTLQWDSESNEKKVDKMMEKSEGCCNPRKNVTSERHSFFSSYSTW